MHDLTVVLGPADYLGDMTDHEQKHAPARLFSRGDISLLARGPRVSVVGSRDASDAGMKRAASFVRALVSRDIVVVSGLAKGIDTVAHTTAIELGGSTIAVLGTPLDDAHPKQNRALQNTIAESHLAVSQFATGQPVTPKNFILRNRTMALLSDATVIVEAGVKSGTEHQGWEALRLGRHVYIFESVLMANVPWAKTMVEYGAQVLNRENLDKMLDGLPSFTAKYQGANEAFAV